MRVSNDTEVEVSGSLLERSREWMPLLAAFPLDEDDDEEG
jgi:hypothetical protein